MQHEHPSAAIDPPLATEGMGVTGCGSPGQGLLAGAAGRVHEFTPLLPAMQAWREERHPR